MHTKDIHHNVKGSTALEAQLIDSDTTTTGEVIDTQGFESTEFFVAAGELADGVFTAVLSEADEIDESGDLVDEALVNAVEGADDLFGDLPVLQNTGADETLIDDSGLTKKFGYKGGKRYLRLDVASTGTTDGGIISGTVAQSSARNAPVE
jgi:hypothetical protein